MKYQLPLKTWLTVEENSTQRMASWWDPMIPSEINRTIIEQIWLQYKIFILTCHSIEITHFEGTIKPSTQWVSQILQHNVKVYVRISMYICENKLVSYLEANVKYGSIVDIFKSLIICDAIIQPHGAIPRSNKKKRRWGGAESYSSYTIFRGWFQFYFTRVRHFREESIL